MLLQHGITALFDMYCRSFVMIPRPAYWATLEKYHRLVGTVLLVPLVNMFPQQYVKG